MNIEKTLLNKFEVNYKEYKDYSDFYTQNSAAVMATMKDQVKELIQAPEDLNKATDFVINTQSLPMLYAIDLNNLKETVLTSYSICKDLAEIPEEVKVEMEALKEKKAKLMFTITKGEAVELHPELIKQYKDRITPEAIQEILRRFKNITDLDNL